jgi:hypothetical protein
VYRLLTGKIVIFHVNFIVQDATIWRSSVWLRLEVPPYTKKDFDDGYSLLLSARASDSLHETIQHGPWILGADDQLADHPDYKEGRPSGCENCLPADVTFTPYIPPAELKQLTSYDLSCLTRFHSCSELHDVLPIAREWEPEYTQLHPRVPPDSCEIPVYARARDITDVLLVDVLSSKTVKRPTGEDPHEMDVQIADVRVIQILKGTFAAVGNYEAVPTTGDGNSYVDSYFEKWPQNLRVGQKYIVFSERTSKDSQIVINFCGAVEDTPAAREQVEQGIAQNDALRHPEEFGGKFW